MAVSFEGRIVAYGFSGLYPVLQRILLYSGLTPGKRLVVLVGLRKTPPAEVPEIVA